MGKSNKQTKSNSAFWNTIQVLFEIGVLYFESETVLSPSLLPPPSAKMSLTEIEIMVVPFMASYCLTLTDIDKGCLLVVTADFLKKED